MDLDAGTRPILERRRPGGMDRGWILKVGKQGIIIFASIGRIGRINSKTISFVFILKILRIDAKFPIPSPMPLRLCA